LPSPFFSKRTHPSVGVEVSWLKAHGTTKNAAWHLAGRLPYVQDQEPSIASVA